MKRRLEASERLRLRRRAREGRDQAGFIPGAVLLPRGFLEMQAEQKLPDKNAKMVVYCAGGTRSAFAAKVLQEMGYTHVESANPGFVRWKDMALSGGGAGRSSPTRSATATRATCCCPRSARRGRRSCSSRACCCSARAASARRPALYLAAAGVGTLGLVDADMVDASNLQRQILHGTDRIGMPKVDSAEKTHHQPEPRREGGEVPGAARPAPTSIASSIRAGT